MTSRRRFLANAAALTLAPATGAAQGSPESAPIGVWGGVLYAGAPLRLRIDISQNDGGALSATLRSLDQGGEPLAASDVAWDGARLALGFLAIGARFEGQVEQDRILGEWRQGGAFPLTLKRDPDFDAMRRDIQPPPLTAESLETLRAKAGAPAMAAAARSARGAEIQFATGRRAADEATPVTRRDPWHLGSITKSVTATLIARLVEAGLLSWEDTVGDALSEVAPEMRETYRGATLLHLLSHHAGLPANIAMWRFLMFPREEDDPRGSRRKYAEIALSQAPEAELGARFVYSNSGYVLAGVMAERAAGAPWETLVNIHIIEPLGLTSAGFGAPGRLGALSAPAGHAAGMFTQAPQPYRLGAGTTDNPAALGPAGRMHMSLPDLLRYLEQHRDRTSFLRLESWDRLHTPPFGSQSALGWVAQGEGRLWHNGSNTLWYAEARIDRAAGHVAAAVCNDGRLATASPAVAQALWAAEIAVRGE